MYYIQLFENFNIIVLFCIQDVTSLLMLRSIWDWEEQFLDRDLIQFHNPLYNPTKIKNDLLEASSEISSLSVWTQCYYRFLPTLEIANGGKPLVSDNYIVFVGLKINFYIFSLFS